MEEDRKAYAFWRFLDVGGSVLLPALRSNKMPKAAALGEKKRLRASLFPA
jgi:hypothetical protein